MITNLAINVQSHADVETKKKLVTRKQEDAVVAVRQDGVVKIATEVRWKLFISGDGLIAEDLKWKPKVLWFRIQLINHKKSYLNQICKN